MAFSIKTTITIDGKEFEVYHPHELRSFNVADKVDVMFLYYDIETKTYEPAILKGVVLYVDAQSHDNLPIKVDFAFAENQDIIETVKNRTFKSQLYAFFETFDSFQWVGFGNPSFVAHCDLYAVKL